MDALAKKMNPAAKRILKDIDPDGDGRLNKEQATSGIRRIFMSI
ncbi:unnamed protein product [Amoebophrya sp. A25]|nr:unnamed protein product [Amoebophrya sp. A25]|eukprot:GSA25T00024421001.1